MKSPKGKPAATAKKKILIVDDHPMMREGLSQLIHNEPDLTICGEAESAVAALAAVAQAAPDLAIIDISLKDSSGLELIKDLKIRWPQLPMLVLSMHDESLYADRVLRAGARGYLMKEAGGRNIMAAIRQVLAGRIYVSEKMSDQLLASASGHSPKTSHTPIDQLTDREFEIFQLIGRGTSARAMAAQLHVSIKTVEAHRVNIKRKLGVSTAPELIRYAVRWVETQTAR